MPRARCGTNRKKKGKSAARADTYEVRNGLFLHAVDRRGDFWERGNAPHRKGVPPIWACAAERRPYSRADKMAPSYFFHLFVIYYHKEVRVKWGIKMRFCSYRIKSFLAGTLAAALLLTSFSGCQSAVQEQLRSALKELGGLTAPAGDTLQSAGNNSAAAGSAKPAAEVKNPVASGTQVGNQSMQKIAADQSAEEFRHTAVAQGKVSGGKYTKVDQRTGYAFLSDAASRSVYEEMLKSAYEIADKPASAGYYPLKPVVLKGKKLTEAQLRVVMLAFLNDNPQVFWVAGAYSYQYDGSSMVIQLYSAVSSDKCAAMIQTLNGRLSAVLGAMPAGLSELDRELYLSEYLVNRCAYDTAAVTDQTRWKSFSAYGALAEGSAVCEGYSRAMQLLSCYAGLSCSLATGTGNGGSHMWNQIKIDGDWYYLDLTWDDNNPEVYNYFNVTDAVLRQTHTLFPLASSLSASQISGASGTPAGFNLFLPPCTATAANYYKAEGIHIATLSNSGDAAVIGAVVNAAKQQRPSLSFYLEKNLDYGKTISGLLSNAPQKLFYYLLQANRQLPSGKKIATDSLSYLEDAPNRGLTVYLTYR